MENKPAFPVIHGNVVETTGLTKRELFAAMAMQGLAAKENNQYPNQTAVLAVKMADSLIEELEKTKE